jgi:hypothetical protein
VQGGQDGCIKEAEILMDCFELQSGWKEIQNTDVNVLTIKAVKRRFLNCSVRNTGWSVVCVVYIIMSDMAINKMILIKKIAYKNLLGGTR